MPKKMSRNKRSNPRMSSRTVPRYSRPDSVKDLLAHKLPGLKRVTDQAVRQSFWNGWLCGHIPAAMRTKISGVAERDGTLVIFAESAAWSARLRYAVHELEGEIRAANPKLTEIEVRVLPRR
jgi:hypothetical protein